MKEAMILEDMVKAMVMDKSGMAFMEMEIRAACSKVAYGNQNKAALLHKFSSTASTVPTTQDAEKPSSIQRAKDI